MRACLVFVAAGLAAACCPPMPGPATAMSAGSGGAGSATTGCDGARAHVAELYRGELAGSGRAGAAGTVDDNTAMVMKDCAKDPARVAACAAAAKSVAELEHDCVIPLDPEGTEGDALKK